MHAAIEQRADLLAKTLRAIDPARRRFIAADAERSHTARHTHIFSARRFHRDPRRRAIDFRDAVFESESLQPHRVRAKCIRLDHPRAGRDVLLMDRLDPIRLAHAQLFETTLDWNSRLEQQRPDRAVAAKHARLQFIKQIHATKRLTSHDLRVKRGRFALVFCNRKPTTSNNVQQLSSASGNCCL